MSIYSDEEIVKAFKTYIKKVVHNAAIDYARIVKNEKYKEVLFTELVDRKVSLSNYGSGTFFIENNLFKEQNLDSNTIYKFRKIISTLKEKDQIILRCSFMGKSNLEIAEILNLSEKTIRNRKSLAKKTIIERLGNNNENFDK
ncbi:MAG: sigma-70 family RNA polymerase sigma factor [Clostridiales bacterium]|nr:sigma-70 family RNA polymerase sigma factor [Clostridiales bacterium]